MKKNANVFEADDTNFDDLVLHSKEPVLVDFGGRWCAPCKVLAPIVGRLADERAGTLRVVTVDIDDAPEVARRYGVRSVPTVVSFVNGVATDRIVGVTTRERLLGLFE